MCFPSLALAQNALTLDECYRLALKQSEKLAIEQQKIKEAEGHFLQSFSGIMPKVSYSYENVRQDARSDTSFTLDQYDQSRFVFSQPLFSGFKEFAAMAGSRAEKRQHKLDQLHAEQSLMIDVADAFYNYLGYQEQLTVLEETQKALRERMDVLKKRMDIGRSRRGDVSSAEARLGRTLAETERVRGEADVWRELLEFLIGQSIDQIVDSSQVGAIDLTIDEINRKAQNRSDVKALNEAVSVEESKVKVAQSALWPSVGVDGNYYTKRAGVAENVDWDVTLRVDVDLFRGGENVGTIKQAKAIKEQAQLKYQEAVRRAAMEIAQAVTRYQSMQKRHEILQHALESVEKNYKYQKEDYQTNLVSNLDVLQALQDFQEVQRELISAESEAKRLYWNFKMTSGESPHVSF